MVKRLLAVAIFLGILPVMASAASWSLNTWVRSGGGSMTSRNMVNQLSTDGSIFRFYTTHAPLSVTVSANTGYSINTVTVNGTPISAPASPYTATVQGMTNQVVFATFTPAAMSITATASSGGSVSPTSVPNIYYGTRLSSNLVFTFTPQAGFALTSLTGASGATVSPAVPAPTNSSVTVTYPAGYTVNAPIALSGTFGSVNPIAVAGPTQTVLTRSLVTLTGSYTGGSGVPPTYTWTQFAGPTTVTLTPNGNLATFTPPVPGTYSFRLTLDTGSAATTNIIVTDSMAVAARNTCQFCHDGNKIGNPQLFSNWSTSQHKANQVICGRCHVGADSGGHPGQVTFGKVSETTFTYTNGSGSFCLNGTCHNPGVTHKTVGMVCAYCHNSGEIHNPNATFAGAVAANACWNCHGGPNTTHYFTKASIPNTQCANCHNSGRGHNPMPAQAVPRSHFNGYTSYVNPGYAAAYVTPDTACSDCHKGGDPSTTEDAAIKQFRLDWGASAHGGTRLSAWANSASRNWKAAGTAGSSAATNSVTDDCVRCHTAKGFVQAVTNGALDPVGVLSTRSSEPLGCNACHTPDFVPRALPAATAYYNYSAALVGKQTVRYEYPDVKESNICMNCHSGRLGGDTIKAIAAKTVHQSYSGSFWHNVRFIDGHYLSAGGQVFGVTGYEYPGQNYGNFSVDHSSLNVAAGTGPCVACHMQNSTHTYLAAAGSVCGNCHGNGNMTDALLASRKADFLASLKALQAALTARGFAPNLDANGNLADNAFSVTDWGGAADGPGNMGAAFNFALLTRDQGAFAHNPTYTKRLIRDSLDWLLYGSLNRTRDIAPAVAALPITQSEQTSVTTFLAGSANGSASCGVCHSASVDLAGNPIIATYNTSKHSQVVNGPACANCHAPSAQVAHPGTDMLVTTPDVSAKCAGCHPLHSWPSQGICARCHNGHNPKQVHIPYPHYSTYTTAQLVTTNFTCDNCHYANDEAGNTSFNVYSANMQWSRSSKGNNFSPTYLAYDFKTMGSPAPATPANSAGNDCVRCHTTTGYINYVSSNFTDIRPWGISGLQPGGDRTREMIACPACHNPTPFKSYDSAETDEWGTPLQPAFSRRVVPQVTAYYNFSSPGVKVFKGIAYPQQGESNNCIACHSGTRAGSNLKQIATAVGGAAASFWSNTPFIDPHGMGGAGVVFSQTGYTFTGRTYRSSVYFVHDNIADASEGGQGPCIACHLYTNKEHLFSPVSSSNGRIAKVTGFEQSCSFCHSGGSLDFSNPANLDAKKQGFVSSLKALAAVMAGKGIHYNPDLAPYFFTDAVQQDGSTALRNWNFLYTPSKPLVYTGSDVMGAAFNLRLLWKDAGAYAHNDYYVKKLIYDSFDLIDDGTLNSSVYSNIQKLATSGSFTADDMTRALAYMGIRPTP